MAKEHVKVLFGNPMQNLSKGRPGAIVTTLEMGFCLQKRQHLYRQFSEYRFVQSARSDQWMMNLQAEQKTQQIHDGDDAADEKIFIHIDAYI